MNSIHLAEQTQPRNQTAAPDQPKSGRIGHWDFLDSLRGLAVLMVIAYHALGVVYPDDMISWSDHHRIFHPTPAFLLLLPFTYGPAGVAVFFAVSGFCIHISHSSARSKDWTTFGIRRFYRIYPPYIVALAFFGIVQLGWDLHHQKRMLLDLVQFATHALGIHNLYSGTFFGINNSFWSIAVELQLYAIYPLLLWAARRLGWGRALLVTFASEAGVRTIQTVMALGAGGMPLLTRPTAFFYSPFAYWFSWSVGAYVAQCRLTNAPCAIGRLPFFPVLALAVGCNFWIYGTFFSFTWFALATAIFCSRMVNRTSVCLPRPGLSSPHLLRWIGTMSYSLYLLHQPLVAWFTALAFPSASSTYSYSPILRFALCLCLTIPIFGIAYGFYRWIELPSIAAGKRLLARRSAAAYQLSERNGAAGSPAEL